MNKAVELVWREQARVGECPMWDAERGVLYWVDIPMARLYTYHPATSTMKLLDLKARGKADFLGFVVLAGDGKLIAGVDRRLALLDPQTGELETLAEVDTELPLNRFNDGKADPAGRILAGTMDRRCDGVVAGSLYSFDRERHVEKLKALVYISNGLTWSPDGRTLYFVDSGTHTIEAFDYDLASGLISHPRTACVLPTGDFVADGMTSDSQGMLWVALWGAACVTRWDPTSGRMIGLYPVPALQPASCFFGGPQRSTLYITTACDGMTEEQLEQYPLSGSLFKLETEVVGEEGRRGLIR